MTYFTRFPVLHEILVPIVWLPIIGAYIIWTLVTKQRKVR